MKKEEFLAQLKTELIGMLGTVEIQEILDDQEEFIREAVASGRQEEEVVASLGNPKNFADSLKLENQVKKIQDSQGVWDKSKETWKATGLLIALMPLNLFLILVPGVALLSFVLSWLSVGVSLLCVGAVMIFGSFFSMLFGFTFLQFLGLFLLSVGTFAFGVCSLALLYKAMQVMFELLIKYFNWNVKVFKGASL